MSDPKAKTSKTGSDYRHQGFYFGVGAGLALAWVDGRTHFLENGYRSFGCRGNL